MPRPASTVIHSRYMQAMSAKHYLSSLRIESLTVVRDSTGGQSSTWTVKYAHIKCTVTPISRLGQPGTSHETRRSALAFLKDARIIGLDGHYPDIETPDRAVVEDRVYDIIAVEHDSHETFTRLIVEDVR